MFVSKMMAFMKKLFEKPKNPLCECEKDCGAHIYYTQTGVGKVWCPTVKARLMEPFKQYPWNQVGVNGQTLTENVDGSWLLKSRDGKVMSRGNM